jgi:4-amino-4-deoxy-L-arabinose transferase-like glycosyltransferase
MSRSRKIEQLGQANWILPVILLLGAIVRLWGINFGLPHTECRPDETAIISRSLQFFSGDFNPHFFTYPTLYLYLLFGVYLVYYVMGQTIGIYQSPDDLMREFVHHPSHLYLLDRLLSLSFGVLTIAIVYWIGKKLCNAQTAAIAALFLSLTPLHVRDSHFGVTDVTQTFFVVTAVCFMLYMIEGDRETKATFQSYLWAGIFSGLAFSTKYTSLPLIVTFLLTHSLRIWKEREGWKDKIVHYRPLIRGTQLAFLLCAMVLLVGASLLTPDFVSQYLTRDGILENPDRLPALQKLLGILGGTCLVLPVLLKSVRFFAALIDKNAIGFVGSFLTAFLVGTPFALLDPKTFGAEFASVIRASTHATTARNLGTGLSYHFHVSLPLGLGICLFVAAWVGIIATLKRDARRAAILLAFPACYYLLIGGSSIVLFRYMTLLTPFACITAAIGVGMLVDRLSKAGVGVKQFRSPEVFFSLVLVTLILVQPVMAIAQTDRLLATPDNRLVAAEWFRKNTPQSASIYQTGFIYGQPVIDRSPRLVAEHLMSPQINGQKSLATQLLPLQADYVERYPQWDYDPSVGVFYFNQKLQTGLPDYMIIQENAIDPETLLDAGLAEIIQTSYRLKRSFRAMETKDPQNRFDLQDAFYLPFFGFRNVQRPGTNLYIYQLMMKEKS